MIHFIFLIKKAKNVGRKRVFVALFFNFPFQMSGIFESVDNCWLILSKGQVKNFVLV